MVNPAPDPATAELERIREQVAGAQEAFMPMGTTEFARNVQLSFAPRLLAAVERLSKLAAEWERDAAYLNARAERNRHKEPIASAKLDARAQAKREDADELVTAITAALTGKEADCG